MIRLVLLLFLLLPMAAVTATATPIYRCGQTYSQTPCAGGKLIDSADPRTAAQRAEARRASEREKKLATQMERDRLGQEAASAPAAGTLDTRPGASAPKEAAKGSKKGGKKPAKAVKPAKAASGNDVVVITPRPKAAP
ncbi:MAG: hypothetical protein ACJ8G7_05630 [Rhizobacter sp.]